MSEAEATKPLWAKCGACSHCWPVAYLPMEIMKFASIAKSPRCPKCGERKKVFAAKQDDGVLKEPV